MQYTIEGLHSRTATHLQPPSVFLPTLPQLLVQPPAAVDAALRSLRHLYWPAWVADENAITHTVKKQRIDLPTLRLHETLSLLDTPSYWVPSDLPDSGYASAEEEGGGENEEEELEVLRADKFERAYAVRWLTGLIARGEDWAAGDMAKTHIIEEAAALLSRCADTHADGTLARRFVFGSVAVELWDESYADDHVGVGLQTWASACVLAARVCAEPANFGLGRRVRVLELGAGTGLLSLAIAARCPNVEIVATDFHPGVLSNLRGNVARNVAAQHVRVEMLDWAHPPEVRATERFDVIMGADVVYDVRHGVWIKRCAEALLRPGGTMWMIVALRQTREREVACVTEAFTGGKGGLKILHVEEMERRQGVGRADEIGYKIFKVGW